MDTHRQLPAWQLARQLTTQVYRLTETLPADERFVLTQQLRRAVWSVLNNIAEGNAKLGRRERRRYLDIALGSLAEIDAMVLAASDIYSVEDTAVASIGRLRVKINAEIFKLLRGEGRQPSQ